jgi:hypothetical protein
MPACLQVLVMQATSCIVMHAANLSFTSVTINTGSGARCLCGLDDACATSNCSSVILPTASSSSSTVVLDLGLMLLDPGTVAELHFNYLLPVGGPQQQLGLWRSQPFALPPPAGAAAGPASDREVLLSTQLQKEGARQLMPCFDEPHFRAQFTLRVELPAGKVALSNMRQAATRPSGGSGVVVTFETSPPMPTYLMALAVGSLERVSAPLEGFEGGRARAAPKQASRAPCLGGVPAASA